MDRVPGLHDVPPAPRVPSPRARHVIFGYQGRQKVLLVAGAILLAVGLVMSIVLCWGLPVDLAIALNPQRVQGTILSAQTNYALKVNGRRPTRVRFQYEGGGTRWEGTSNSFQVRPDQSGTVPVEYAALQPAWGRLAGETYATFGFLALFSLAMPLLGAALLSNAIRANRREIHVFTHGRPALARVTFRGQDHATRVNGRHPFLLQWEFKTESGAIHQGSISSMRLLDIKDLGDHEQIVILYDPDHPGVNTLYVP